MLKNTPKPAAGLRLALLGTGALGSAVCRLLLQRAQPDLLLIDPDCVQPHNLSLNPSFDISALGRAKVNVLAEHAQAHKPPLAWIPLQAEIADVAFTRLQQVDVLLCCPDSALARVEATFAARSLGLLLLDAGVQSHLLPEGRVACFVPAPSAACYLCGFTEARRAELLAFALSPSLGCTLPPDAHTAPISAALATIERTAEALLQMLDQMLDGVVFKTPETSFAQRILDGHATGERIALSPSATCPWHRLPSPLQALPGDKPVHTLLPPGMVLEFPWPVCLEARCLHCAYHFSPRRRTAFVRRRLPCPACLQAGSIEPLRTLGTLAATDPDAARTLRELGLPDGHLYHLRSALVPQSLAEGAVRA